MPETTPLIKAALNLRVGAGFDVYFIYNNEMIVGQRTQVLLDNIDDSQSAAPKLIV